MSLQTEKIFHNLTLEQVQELDKVLTEIIPIYGRGNFPTLEVKAKDIIRVVRDRLVERDIQVKDIRLNGSTASHVMVRDNGMGYRDLDIIFGVELPRQEDLKVIKEVVLGSLRDLLPCGVNRRKITWLTMKEAYVQKMVKVFNEHDRWSLISLSNSRSKTVGLRFVSSLRRQFEFSVDSFQIILDHMLESYWETEKKQEAMLTLHGENLANFEKKELEEAAIPQSPGEDNKKDSTRVISEEKWQEEEEVPISAKETSCLVVAAGGGREQVIESPMAASHTLQYSEADDKIEDIDSEGIVFHLSGERMDEKAQLKRREHFAVSSQTLLTEIMDPLAKNASSKLQDEKSSESRALSEPSILHSETFTSQKMIQAQSNEKTEGGLSIHRSNKDRIVQDSHREFSFPPPAKKTCSTSQDIIPGYCHSPILQRKMSHKTITKPPLPEKWSLLSDPSDFTTQLIQPIEIPKTIQPKLNSADVPCSNLPVPVLKQPEGTGNCENHMCHPVIFQEGSSLTQAVKPKNPKKPPDSNEQSHPCVANTVIHTVPHGAGPGLLAGRGGNPTIGVKAECMYGNFEQALNHLRHRLITTHGPEEIRGGGLLKYSDLLVRNFRPASEIEIKSLERYMCSRFFIDFPDVAEQQRKIEAYLQCHFIGNEEASKYDYLMTLRCVIDESTVCLMGHERRQTLNMITVLALRVLGEQNAIPNTANVTCFYQPAPYMADLMFSSYYFAHAQHPLVYHPYPLHVHIQTGLV